MYLGLMIEFDNELKWTVHTDHVCKSVIEFIFYKLRAFVSKDIPRTLCYALVYPHLLYGVELYANTSRTHLDKLMKLNGKILRILQNRPRLTAIKSLYHDYGTYNLPIYELHENQLLLFVDKIIDCNEHLPDLFKSYFDENSMLHSYNTSSKSDLHLNRINTTCGQ
jgi:hypothetical protein